MYAGHFFWCSDKPLDESVLKFSGHCLQVNIIRAVNFMRVQRRPLLEQKDDQSFHENMKMVLEDSGKIL
jgi:hypothetical protein